jgi:hypothetical protein
VRKLIAHWNRPWKNNVPFNVNWGWENRLHIGIRLGRKMSFFNVNWWWENRLHIGIGLGRIYHHLMEVYSSCYWTSRVFEWNKPYSIIGDFELSTRKGGKGRIIILREWKWMKFESWHWQNQVIKYQKILFGQCRFFCHFYERPNFRQCIFWPTVMIHSIMHLKAIENIHNQINEV